MMVDNRNLVYSAFSNKGFVKVSDSLTHYLGDFTIAGIVSRMISLSRYYEDRGELREGKWFFWTRESIENQFKVSHFTQRQIFEKLEKLNLVESKMWGGSINRRKYYALNFEKLAEILSDRNNHPDYDSQKVEQHGE